MENTKLRAALVAAAAADILVTASMGVANASANKKQPGYTSHAESSAGLDVLGSLGGPSLVAIGQTDSTSDTDKDDGASSTSSADSLRVLDQSVGGTANCDSDGAEGNGVQREDDSETFLLIEEDPAAVALLSASCESRAVQSNNASSSAKAAVLTAEAAGIEIVVLGSSSSTKTTSGQAGSGQTGSSFTVLSVNETTVLGCTAQSQTTKGSERDSSSVVLLNQEIEDFACPLASADTSYEQTKPAK